MRSERVYREQLNSRSEELFKIRESNDLDWGIDTYAGVSFLSLDEAAKAISDAIESSSPVLVGRLGETETRTVRLFTRDCLDLNQLRLSTHDICNNAGFFPRKIGAIRKFTRIYDDAVMNMDYIGALLWQDEEYWVSQSDTLKGAFAAAIIDPVLYGLRTWIQALEGKKVLVVSPFAESIEKQYSVREKLFSEDMRLPDFDLRVFKAVQSIGGKGAEGFETWFEALSYMQDSIDKIDYDVALLGCGAYGMPLGSHIKDSGKPAIYVGGCLQLMFGIIGKRWEARDYFAKLCNEHWIRPGKEEIPHLFNNVEDGCYW